MPDMVDIRGHAAVQYKSHSPLIQHAWSNMMMMMHGGQEPYRRAALHKAET